MLALKGIIPPMVTPMDEEGRVDEASTRSLVQHMLKSGVDGFFLLGTMGEGASLCPEDKERLIRTVVSEVGGRVPVLAGATEATTARTVANAQRFEKLGVDAVVVMQPFFYKGLNQQEVEGHFLAVVESITKPVVIYNNPGLTGNAISLSTLGRLAAHPHIIGTKDSTANFSYFMEVLRIRARVKEFAVFQGDEWAVAASLLCGADGAVIGMGSLAGKLFKRLYTAAKLGNVAEAVQLQMTLIDMFDGIYDADRHQWLTGHKEALHYLGIIRCPKASVYQMLTWEERHRVRRCVDQYREYL